MRKKIISIIANRKIWQSIFFILTGLIVGCYVGEYAKIRYENELMTNWILRHDIKDYIADRIGERVCSEN